MNDFDKALMYGYELANGRDWFSLAMPSATHVDTKFASLYLSGYLTPYPPGSEDVAHQVSNRWQRDYQITAKGFARIQELTHYVDWEAKAKAALEAFNAVYKSEQYGMKTYTWDEIAPVQQHAWIAAVRAVADSFNMRWTESGNLVTADSE